MTNRFMTIIIKQSTATEEKTFETNIDQQNGSLSGLTANLHKAMKVVNEELTKLVDEAKKGLSKDKVEAHEKEEEEDADTEDDEDSNDESKGDGGNHKRLKLDKSSK